MSLNGILSSNLKIGVVSNISAQLIKANLAHAGEVSGQYLGKHRYGKGEVGELVLIEGQQSVLLGRITEISLPDRDRAEISQDFAGSQQVDAIGFIRLLGSVNPTTLKVTAGVNSYPRLGDRIYSAPGEFVSQIPLLTSSGIDGEPPRVALDLGNVSGDNGFPISVTPEKLFGRHCAILGSTGGGKSWTTSKLIQECRRYPSKVVLIDATGEYRSLTGDDTEHFHLGSPIHRAVGAIEVAIPPTSFTESDFIALFQPSGKVQGPKLREAIKSLRLVALAPAQFPEGIVRKIGQAKKTYQDAIRSGDNRSLVSSPSQPFDPSNLVRQLVEECCYPDAINNATCWGGASNEVSFCSSLFTRILSVMDSPSLRCVFKPAAALPSVVEKFDAFFAGDKRLLRICLSSIGYEFNAREVIANAIGRLLLQRARAETFRLKPLIVILDEAHNFLGKTLGNEDDVQNLDAFELIAKEGRKYGLNICLATQRPRDITEGVLSQMGTLLVHRLTNDRDREVVERACGELDRSAAAFLPNLKQGEVAMVGVDFPIPVTIQIGRPSQPPISDGPSFQDLWG
ncbi:ATP-binding protein [Pseudomonas sp. TMW22080]|uniref:ATP-binding protein n=1 Tax=Pseudomonas sp. TMW22080 TaxID=2506432 RepID=UPI001F10213F|nr:ATP-binding protein [Pseudomonas sp. TMW22080]MCH4883223.1 ATP-binding protein [Pseudomonas sp. TMW22080]